MFLFFCRCANGADYVVTRLDDDGGEGTLRQGIAAAAQESQQIIRVSIDGTIHLKSSLSITGNIHIVGLGTSQTRINAEQSQGIFIIPNGASLLVDGVTLADGRSTKGGAVFNEGSFTAVNSIIKGNTALGHFAQDWVLSPLSARGGAIWNSGALILSNTVVAENGMNCPYQRGGAIYSTNGSVQIDNCTFASHTLRDGPPTYPEKLTGPTKDGTCAYGGAIYLSGGQAAITGSTFVKNAVFGGHGADGFIVNDPSSYVAGSGGKALGGAIYSEGATLSLVNCTFSANIAIGKPPGVNSVPIVFPAPGGIFSYGAPGEGKGGAVFVQAGSVSSTNCTFAFNQVGSDWPLQTGWPVPPDELGPPPVSMKGSAIDMSASSGVLQNNLFAGNSGAEDVSGNGLGISDLAVPSTDLKPLADNGGPTWTHLLIGGSRALNSGQALGAPLTDQRGVGRPIGPGVDVGAVEMDIIPPIVLSYSSDQHVHIGTNITLFATFQALPSVTVSWFHDGQLIHSGADTQITINNVQRSDGGNYWAVGKDVYGEVSTPQILVDIIPEPLVLLNSAPQFAAEGEELTLSCAVYAEKPFTLQWMLNGLRLPEGADFSYQLRPMNGAHEGNYTVTVKNGDGEMTSEPRSIRLWPELIVNSIEDTGLGTFRAALEAANLTPKALFRTIRFSRGGVIKLGRPLPEIQGSVRIQGQDARTNQLDGGGKYPLLKFANSTTSVVSHLTLSGGLTALNESGGAIHNSAKLYVSNCWFRFNISTGGFGGAIHSQNFLQVQNCAFQTNSSLAENSGGGIGGGAGMGGRDFRSARHRLDPEFHLSGQSGLWRQSGKDICVAGRRLPTSWRVWFRGQLGRGSRSFCQCRGPAVPLCLR